MSIRRSRNLLSGAERTGRHGSRAVPDVRGPGCLPGLGAGGRRLSWRVGRHDAARATSDAGRMADGARGDGTGGGEPHGPATDSETAHPGRPRRPGRFLTEPSEVTTRRRPAKRGAGGTEHAEVPTPYGPARVELDRPAGPVRSLLVLGHGAGGGVDAPDLLAVRRAALSAGVLVARVTQPYRVKGRRTPAPVAQLDDAWITVVSTLRAAGVVALAFPLHPPGKAADPTRSRAAELATGLPTLVVNGDRDPFGVPAPGPDVEVCVRPGERHDLRRDPAAVGTAVVAWLAHHGWAAPSS